MPPAALNTLLSHYDNILKTQSFGELSKDVILEMPAVVNVASAFSF